MRPRTIPDWIAFVLLLIGAFAWAAFVTDVNVLDRALEPIADPSTTSYSYSSDSPACTGSSA